MISLRLFQPSVKAFLLELNNRSTHLLHLDLFLVCGRDCSVYTELLNEMLLLADIFNDLPPGDFIQSIKEVTHDERSEILIVNLVAPYASHKVHISVSVLRCLGREGNDDISYRLSAVDQAMQEFSLSTRGPVRRRGTEMLVSELMQAGVCSLDQQVRIRETLKIILCFRTSHCSERLIGMLHRAAGEWLRDGFFGIGGTGARVTDQRIENI